MASLYLQYDSAGENLTASSVLDISALEVNGVAPGNDQYLTTNNLGALTWIPKQVLSSNIKCMMHYTLSGFNFNSGPSTVVQYEVLSAFSNMGGDILFDGSTSFSVLQGGVYRIDYLPSVIASASYVSISIRVNGTNQTLAQINQSATSCSCVTVENLIIGDVITVLSTRVGANASAKNSITGPNIGPIIITRLV